MSSQSAPEVVPAFAPKLETLLGQCEVLLVLACPSDSLRAYLMLRSFSVSSVYLQVFVVHAFSSDSLHTFSSDCVGVPPIHRHRSHLGSLVFYRSCLRIWGWDRLPIQFRLRNTEAFYDYLYKKIRK